MIGRSGWRQMAGDASKLGQGEKSLQEVCCYLAFCFASIK